MIKKVSGLLFISGLILALFSCAPVTIETAPAGAAVYSADGQTQLGTTPYDTRVWFTEKDLVVRQDRYFEEPVKMNFDTPKEMVLKLRPTPVSVYSRPQAEIYPVGSETPIGTAPMKVAVGDKPTEYVLKLADYYDQTISVGVDSPDPLIVEMARRPIVTISAEPEGVEIYENGQLLGTAPVRIEVLSPRTIELHKEGYFAQGGTLKGAPPYEVHGVLRPFPVLSVSATPSSAKISKDGELLGTGSAQLAVGKETLLNITADRFYPQTLTLTPESGTKSVVALKAMPYVMIKSEPSGAEVIIDGKSVGMTPVEQLIEKETTIQLVKGGFVSQTATLTGKDASVNLTLEVIHPTPEEIAAAEKAAAEKAAAEKAAAEKAAAEKAAKQRNLMIAIGGAVAVAAAVLIVVLMKKKKK